MSHTFHLHGSLFPENYPKNSPVEVRFAPLSGKPTLQIGGTLALHLGEGDLEATIRSLYAAADALRLFSSERDLTPDEQEALAAGESTQSGGLVASLSDDGRILVEVR